MEDVFTARRNTAEGNVEMNIHQDPCSWAGGRDIAQLSVLPTVVCGFGVTLLSIPTMLFVKINPSLKFTWELQRTAEIF